MALKRLSGAAPARLPGALLTAMLMAALSGCGELGYYAQAARGQLAILAARQDIQRLVDDPAAPARLRRQLRLAQQLRRFAIERLALPESRAYTTYAATGREFVVWNVLAAPPDAVTLQTWCFPIAGCAAYKGYFSKPDAAALERELAARHYDTLSLIHI